MIFQDPYSSLNPRKRVVQIVGDPFRINGLGSRAEVRQKVQELLEVVGLSAAHLNRYPHEFSGGQRQRIGVARALALNPQLIVADEPVSALDVSIQAQVVNLLHDLQQDFNLTYVFIAHDLGVVRHVSDRVAVMYLGVIVEIAPADDLFARPVHPYTEALLSAIPVIETGERDEVPRRERIVLEGEVPSPIEPAERMPVPSPLPVRDGDLPRRDTAPRPLRQSTFRCLSPPARRGGSDRKRVTRARATPVAQRSARSRAERHSARRAATQSRSAAGS